jgi:hypothetical protein
MLQLLFPAISSDDGHTSNCKPASERPLLLFLPCFECTAAAAPGSSTPLNRPHSKLQITADHCSNGSPFTHLAEF